MGRRPEIQRVCEGGDVGDQKCADLGRRSKGSNACAIIALSDTEDRNLGALAWVSVKCGFPMYVSVPCLVHRGGDEVERLSPLFRAVLRGAPATTRAFALPLRARRNL